MPPTRVEAQRSGRNRAASVPVGRREHSVLDSLRLKKQSLSTLDVKEDIPKPPPSLPSVVITRGRKRASSSCAVSQVDCMPSTSASIAVAAPFADASEQLERPQKRRKRSSSTPAAPPLPAQRQSRRRSRSRAGSPTADAERVQPTRVSTRLARKIHSFVNDRNLDIYAHLAGPDGARDLLNRPPVSSVTLSIPDATANPQSGQKSRRRQRKVVDLRDENAKKDLIEEWARIRQSQGTLPLSGLDENACSGQVSSCETRGVDGTVSSVPLRRHTSDPGSLESQMTMLNDSHKGFLSTRMDSDNRLPVARDEAKLGRACSPSGGRTDQPAIEALSTSKLDPHAAESSTNDPGTARSPDLLPYSASCPQAPSPTLQEESAATSMAVNEQVENGRSVTSFGNTSIHLDSDEEFYMLDIPEVFTLPWEPVASCLYVPPSLGKLISGMKEQLTIEARARRRAEELYQTELSRRISAEKIIENLRTQLEEMARR